MMSNKYETLQSQWRAYTDPSERSAFRNSIVSRIIEAFIDHHRDVKETRIGHPDLVIVNLGMHDALPAVFIDRLIESESLFLVHTKESKHKLCDFSKITPVDLMRVIPVSVDAHNALTIYREIKNEIEAMSQLPKSVHVDITGGTSVMSAALAMIASSFNGTMSYIKHDVDDRNPVPFSEELVILEDPLTVFGELRMPQIRESFRNHYYSVSNELLTETIRKLSGYRHEFPDIYSKFSLRLEISKLYESWEKFDLAKAKESCEKLTGFSGTSFPDWPSGKFKKHATAIDLLMQLMASDANMLLLLHDKKLVQTLLMHLLNSASRQEIVGHYATGILLIYRCLEMCIQYRLSVYGIDTSAPDYSSLDLRFPKWRNKCAQFLICLDKRTECAPDKIALFIGYAILRSIEDPFAIKIDPNQLDRNLTVRNRMLLEHGFSVADKKQLITFLRFAENKCLRILFEIEGWDWSEAFDSTQFLKDLP